MQLWRNDTVSIKWKEWNARDSNTSPLSTSSVVYLDILLVSHIHISLFLLSHFCPQVYITELAYLQSIIQTLCFVFLTLRSNKACILFRDLWLIWYQSSGKLMNGFHQRKYFNSCTINLFRLICFFNGRWFKH